ncbi:MAG: IS630 transposase-related protein [Planctomycetes bacterium]|nr:IS630 transposase-related protein [Planctomycetota bacterium]
MGASYSQDLRDRVFGARDRGLKTKEVADLFDVSPSWVRRVLQRRREEGRTTPLPRGGVTVVKIDMERLRQLVQEQPDATIRELHERLGIACCESAVGMALGRLGLSFKKRRSTPRSRTGPTSPSGGRSGKTLNPRATPSD